MSEKGYWYAAGLEHHAEELETAARLARLRSKRLDESYRGEPLKVFSEAMDSAAGELRKAAKQLRPPKAWPLPGREAPE